MSREMVCPECGTRLPEVPRAEAADTTFDPGVTVETVIPVTVCTDDSHSHQLAESGSIDAVYPPSNDVQVVSTGEVPSDSGVWIEADRSSSSSELIATPPPHSDFIPEPAGDNEAIDLDDPFESTESAPSESFPVINFDRPADGPAAVEAPAETPSEIEETEDEPARGMSWPVVLLASYASAMTLACAWLWWHRDRGDLPDSLPSDSRPDLGARGQRSLRLDPVEPIAADRKAAIGKMIRLDDLEITPLGVGLGRVELEHKSVDGGRQSRDGGSGVLILRLRVKNVSKDAVFAPLDEAFLRSRERGLPDSFLETADGGRIDPYPLAVESEWSIVGQPFHELKPGQSLETIVASEKDVADRTTPEMTWRLKLRTGADRTGVVGVPFRSEDIK